MYSYYIILYYMYTMLDICINIILVLHVITFIIIIITYYVVDIIYIVYYLYKYNLYFVIINIM